MNQVLERGGAMKYSSFQLQGAISWFPGLLTKVERIFQGLSLLKKERGPLLGICRKEFSQGVLSRGGDEASSFDRARG